MCKGGELAFQAFATFGQLLAFRRVIGGLIGGELLYLAEGLELTTLDGDRDRQRCRVTDGRRRRLLPTVAAYSSRARSMAVRPVSAALAGVAGGVWVGAAGAALAAAATSLGEGLRPAASLSPPPAGAISPAGEAFPR